MKIKALQAEFNGHATSVFLSVWYNLCCCCFLGYYWSNKCNIHHVSLCFLLFWTTCVFCCMLCSRHRLKAEATVNTENLWNLNFWFPSSVASLRHRVCCWHYKWQACSAVEWPWLIGVWSLSLPPTSIWKPSSQVWNMFVRRQPLSALSTPFVCHGL